jgi:hypothetical protein
VTPREEEEEEISEVTMAVNVKILHDIQALLKRNTLTIDDYRYYSKIIDNIH